MKIPNVLSLAQRLVTPQSVQLKRWIGTQKNAALVLSPVYAEAVPIAANVEPVDRTVYQAFGLDLQKDYIWLYSTVPLRDLERDKAPDIILWSNQTWNVESNTDWQDVNGWKGSLCVAVGATAL